MDDVVSAGVDCGGEDGLEIVGEIGSVFLGVFRQLSVHVAYVFESTFPPAC